MTPEAILTLVASPVLGGAAAKLWQWWAERDRAQREAAAEAARAATAAGAAERTDVIALLRDQIAKGEERGEKSAARADAMADALRAVAEQTRSLAAAVDELRGAVTEHAHREEATLASLDGRLSLLTPAPPTGEQPRASVVPDPPRLPSPSPLRPATPPPPRRPA